MNAATARRAAAPRPPTATDRVYDGIYRAIVEHQSPAAQRDGASDDRGSVEVVDR